MEITLPKTRIVIAPRSLSFVFASVGGVALFLLIVSLLRMSNPIGSTIHEYLVGLDRLEEHSSIPSMENENQSMVLGEQHSAFAPTISFDQIQEVESPIRPVSIFGDGEMEVGGIFSIALGDDTAKNASETKTPNLTLAVAPLPSPPSGNVGNDVLSMIINDNESVLKVSRGPAFAPALFFDNVKEVGSPISPIFTIADEGMEVDGTPPSGLTDDSKKNQSDIHSAGLASSNFTLGLEPIPPPSSNIWKGTLRKCDLYRGRWIHDPVGPLYTSNKCPIVAQGQNCQRNGRPDKEYENWRWKPYQCDIPRFDARKFLELMKGKTLAIIGDSLARNQMESMLCILWQVEVPENHGSHQKHKWYFKSTNSTIVRIWSAWSVHKTTEPLPPAPPDIVKLHLDIPDESFMEFLPSFDIVVLSFGHWFSKPSAYLLKGNIVGGHLWHPKRSRKKLINNAKAYSIALDTSLKALATLPNYKGLTIVRSYSPGHFTGGAWNAGGSCGKFDRPASKPERDGHTKMMYKVQLEGYERAVKKVRNGAKFRLMNITEAFGYRHDGHPGPYTSPSSNMVRKEDCVHWCLPGPIDTWNQILFEIIRREF